MDAERATGRVGPERLWSVRAVRHLTMGTAPLLVIGVAVFIVLTVHAANLRSDIRRATATATATVTAVGVVDGTETTTVKWTDATGVARTGFPVYAQHHGPQVGDRIELRYVPGRPAHVYTSGDATDRELTSINGSVVLVVIVVVGAAAAVAVRIARRRLAARRSPTRVLATPVHVRLGLIHRAWLLLTDGDRELWLPVCWDTAVAGLLAETPVLLRGRLGRGLCVVDTDDASLWASGPLRRRLPLGRHIAVTARWSKGAASKRTAGDATAPVPLRRQARGDAALVLAAPLLGLLWAYVDVLGPVGFALATAIFAGILIWAPSMYGSDPT